MTWFLNDPTKYRHALKELPKQRDRGAAIIATSILEDHLILAILSRMHRDADAEGRMFKGYGPLNTLASRIDLGLLLGIYPRRHWEILHIIRNIRNEFAHNMQPTSFRSQRALCAKLGASKSAHRSFNKSFKSITGRPDVPLLDMFRITKNPRTQFIRSVQQITMILSLSIALAEKDNAKGPRMWLKERTVLET